MAIGTLEGMFFGLNHMRERPIHFSVHESVLTTVGQAGVLAPKAAGQVPVKFCPVTAGSPGARCQKIKILFVVNLPAPVYFERPDFGFGVPGTTERPIDLDHVGRIDFLPG